MHLVWTQPYLINTVDKINFFFNYDKEKKLSMLSVKNITLFAIYVTKKVINIRKLVAPMVFTKASTKPFMSLSH